MSRWFELKLDFAEAILLKKAVRVFTQVAYSDRELPTSMFNNFIPNNADLHLSPTMVLLVSTNSHFRFPEMATVLAMKPPCSSVSRLWCSKSCRTLCVSLHRLKCLLERNTEDSVTLYGDEGAVDRIFYEIGDDEGIKYSSTLPVVSSRDQIQMDLGFVGSEYPMRLGLSSEIFRAFITQSDSHGFKVHARVSQTQVVLRVVNNEMVFRPELGVCEIESEGGRYPFVLKFDLQHKRAFLNAAMLSEMVWILNSADLITVLSFPIVGLGNLMFTQLNPVAPN
ncbi:uncharacterized protein LOC112181464 isoform X1 [Rosa chinensis]|nr:uncharacterized protein LOC112181464 isoform X1 [Rosa chinensis]